MNYSAGDRALTEALEMYQEKWMASLPESGELDGIRFSPAFEKKMKKLIASAGKKTLSKQAKRRIIAIVLAAALLIGLLSSVGAIREPIVRFIEKTNKRETNFTFQIPDNVNPPSEIEEEIYPSYIPEGFAIDESETRDYPTDHDVIYTDKDGRRIRFHQSTMVGAGGGINTEGAEIIEMPINGRRALYYENMGMRNVFWNGDYYSYRIYADDVLSKEEVIKIAKSVKVDFVEK